MSGKLCEQEQEPTVPRSRQQRSKPQNHRRDGALIHESQVTPVVPPRVQPRLRKTSANPVHGEDEDVQKVRTPPSPARAERG